MTKVKTILAEFCSPKEILAINRLGLIKKEERESQPIPWRHRLPNAERKELVKSEMRMSLRPTSRLTSKDKVRAVGAARSPKDSKMGECLLNIHVRGDPSLGPHLGKIVREQRQLEHSHEHIRQTFMKQSQTLNHEPLILVERPPHSRVRRRALMMTHKGVDPEAAALPSYMRPLQNRSKTPSTLTTIDAFTVEPKKKRNVWEEVMDEKEGPKFKSTARPCAPLTDHEKGQLKIGYTLHKPTPESIATPRDELDSDRPVSATLPDTNEEGLSVFITQLPQKDLAKTETNKSNRILRFEDISLESKKADSVPPTTGRFTQSAGSAGSTSRKGSKTPRERTVTEKEMSTHSQAPQSGRERSERKMKNFLSALIENDSP